jgi:hypothetical protein
MTTRGSSPACDQRQTERVDTRKMRATSGAVNSSGGGDANTV